MRLSVGNLFAIGVAAVGVATAGQADDVYWVGYQNGCMVTHPDTGSFFHEDNWLGFVVPEAGDVALFGTGNDPQQNGTRPHYLHFGDFCLKVFDCPNPIPIEGGDAINDRLIIQSDSWTFDFEPGSVGNCTPPGNNSGSYTLTSSGAPSIVVGAEVEATGFPGHAELDIVNGTLSGVAVHLGDTTGSSGDLTVSGSDAVHACAGNMAVGNEGNGTLNILDGGTVSNSFADIGRFAGASGEATVSGLGSSWSCSEHLMVGYQGTGTLTILGGGRLSNTWTHIGSQPGSTGVVTVRGASSSWETEFLGVGDGAQGSLRIESGGTVTSTGVNIGGNASGDGEATIFGSGSTWTCTDYLNVGTWGTGALDISGGAQVSSGGSITAGTNGAPSAGDIVVTGNESALNASGWMEIGREGTGSLTVQGGADVIITQWISTGTFTTASDGEITVAGPGSFLRGDGLDIGREGAGALTISNGGFVSGRWINTGTFTPDSQGQITVTGSASRMSAFQGLETGREGQGTLIIENGAEVTSPWVSIGTFTGSSDGQIIVWDPGSRLVNSGGMAVGTEGQGSLLIEGGGQVSNTWCDIGQQQGSDGTVTVTGEGSEWTCTQPLDCGQDGPGTLNVEAGGKVTVLGDGLVRVAYRAPGQATVMGSGSIVEITGQLQVGTANTGILTISDGGQVDVKGDVPGTGGLGIVGSASMGEGHLTVTGNGSQWTSKAQLQVGRDGAGTLTVSNGAYVLTHKAGSPTASSGIIGTQAVSTGVVTVTGDGSMWEQDGGLSVGFFGQGTMTVDDGGSALCEDGFIGRFSGSNGSATVGSGLPGPSGVNLSSWTASNSFYVGGDANESGGPGQLTVTTDGSVVVGNALEVWQTGVVTVSGGSAEVGNVVRVWEGGAVALSGGSMTVGTGPVETTADTLRVWAGGVVEGTGRITGQLLNSEGEVSPGDSAGLLTIDGDYTQGEGGALDIEIGGLAAGDEYDVLVITGTAAFDGTLNVTFVEGFVPFPGDRFDVVTYGSGHDEYGTINVGNLVRGLVLQALYGDENLTLLVVETPKGDMDEDGDIDLIDYGLFQGCFTGPGDGPIGNNCGPADFDEDADVDVVDFGFFSVAFGGGCTVLITLQPVSATVCPGASVALQVQAVGLEITYQWRHNNVILHGATDPTLSIDPVTRQSAGTYSCRVSGLCGWAVSQPAELVVYDPPEITKQPESVTTCPGLPVEFTVLATGVEQFSYQWQRNGANIPGATEATYSIASVGAQHAGQYRCRVTDDCGQVTPSAPATLTVSPVVVIATQPVGGQYCVGEDFTLFVIAIGSPTYQWFKDDQPVPGATEFFLAIQNAQIEHSGVYHVVVTNQCNSVTSDDAMIIVIECGDGP